MRPLRRSPSEERRIESPQRGRNSQEKILPETGRQQEGEKTVGRPFPTDLPALPDTPVEQPYQKKTKRDDPSGLISKKSTRIALEPSSISTSTTISTRSNSSKSKNVSTKSKARVEKEPISLNQILESEVIQVQNVLKGGSEEKVTCLVHIGDGDYVVKGGEGNAYIRDHIINSDLFRRLALSGVRAPLVELLQPDSVKFLQAKLDLGKPTEKLLSNALNLNPMIATKAPGFTVEEVLSDTQSMRKLLTIVTSAPSLKEARNDLTTELINTYQPPTKKPSAEDVKRYQANQIKLYGTAFDDLKSDDPGKRAAAIELLTNQLSAGRKTILSVLSAIATDQDAGTAVKQLTEKLDSLDRAKAVLSNHFQSKAGASALGGLAFVDLLDGMNDRILSKWNGGNFMFDPQEKDLWCVDNAKTLEYGLLAANDDDWKIFFVNCMTRRADEGMKSLGDLDLGEGVDERLHYLIYQCDSGDRPEFFANVPSNSTATIPIKAAVTQAVDDGLSQLQRLVDDTKNGLADQVRARLKARLAVLAARKKFTDLIKFDPDFDQVPSVTAPETTVIIERKLERAITPVTNLFKSSDEKQVAAQQKKILKKVEEIKGEIRDNKYTRDELLGKEEDIKRLNLDLKRIGVEPTEFSGQTDRRIEKTLFVSKFNRLLVDLEGKVEGLQALSNQPEKPWGTLSDQVMQDIRDRVAPWFTSLREVGDKDGIGRLDGAVEKLAVTLATLY